MQHLIYTFVLAGISTLIPIPTSAGPEPIALVHSIELPGVEGRFDHMALDADTQKLFVAALGNNTIEVLDAMRGIRIKSLPGFREPQGVAMVSDAKRVVVANGQGDEVQLVGVDDYRTHRAVALGDDCDNVRYDSNAKRLYVGYGSGAIAAIDPTSGRIIGNAKLAGHPESFQLERDGARIFVNVPTAEQIAVVDRVAMKVVATWPIVEAKSNYPMALDEANHRLFVACRRPAKVLIYDTTTGEKIASTEIVGDSDDVFYDSTRQRLYVAGGEGFIDILDARQSASLTRIARVTTAPGARTALFVPEQGRLFVAIPHHKSQKSAIRIFEVRD